MKHYTEHIPYDLGKKMKEAGYWEPGCTYDTCYNGPCYALAKDKLYEDGVICDWKDIVPAPTYAEVIDWFFEKGIFIQMEPWHTFALQERMGFVYEINMVNEEKAQIDSEVWNEFASFGLCLNSAIERAIEILKEKENGKKDRE